ncbi:MAG: DUF6036 family nucleotidyltransferase [Candidatus Woesearchaeota archaeon]
MISIEGQQKLLLAVSMKLNQQITAYAIGGTAMMFLGLKDATKDIDLVFVSDKDREKFKKALKELGYKEMDSIKIYGVKRNAPEMLTLGDERFDLFVSEVIDFIFSKKMQERAQMTNRFKDNLILKAADYHDLILMKCATDRFKDKDDVKSILENRKVDWKILVEEAKNQVELGQELAVLELGCFLEDLGDVPKEILDELFGYLKQQAEKKLKR